LERRPLQILDRLSAPQFHHSSTRDSAVAIILIHAPHRRTASARRPQGRSHHVALSLNHTARDPRAHPHVHAPVRVAHADHTQARQLDAHRLLGRGEGGRRRSDQQGSVGAMGIHVGLLERGLGRCERGLVDCVLAAGVSARRSDTDRLHNKDSIRSIRPHLDLLELGWTVPVLRGQLLSFSGGSLQAFLLDLRLRHFLPKELLRVSPHAIHAPLRKLHQRRQEVCAELLRSFPGEQRGQVVDGDHGQRRVPLASEWGKSR
jgi:hypothetical protein